MASSRLDDMAPPTRTRFGVLGFACSLSLLTYLDRICIMRAGADIQSELAIGDEEMGLVFSAFILGYTLFEVPGGWMGDKWGPRRVLTRIVLVWSLFTALTGTIPAFSFDTGIAAPWLSKGTLFINSLVLMLLVRFLFGVGEAGAYPNLARVTRDWFPIRERGFSLGAIWMSARLGGAIAPFVIGRLAANLGWRNAFFILGASGLLWIIAFRRWFTDRPAQHPSCNLAEQRIIEPLGSNGPRRDGHSWPRFGLLIRSANIWAMCFASFWVCFGWYFYPTWQPKYLKQVHGFEPDGMLSEILTGLPFLCGAVGSIAGGKLSDTLIGITGSRRWGRSLVGVFGFVGAGVCVLLTGWATVWWHAVALLCLAFLINDLAIPPLWAVAGEVGGRFAGSVSGLMNMIGGFGAILSPILIPRVLTRLPEDFSTPQRWQWIFVGLAGAWFLGAAAWLVIDSSKPLERDEHALV
jgi:MFS transporter, ACS family, glucarate transporter